MAFMGLNCDISHFFIYFCLHLLTLSLFSPKLSVLFFKWLHSAPVQILVAGDGVNVFEHSRKSRIRLEKSFSFQLENLLRIMTFSHALFSLCWHLTVNWRSAGVFVEKFVGHFTLARTSSQLSQPLVNLHQILSRHRRSHSHSWRISLLGRQAHLS